MTIVASNSLTISNVNDGTITHVAYANKSKDIFYDSLPSFANLPGYQGALVSSVYENGAYKITTTGGTHVMKTYVLINGTSGKALWSIVRLKNTHPTNNLRLAFNGIGDGTVLNNSFPTIIIKPGEDYFFMKPGIARNNYDFIQITFWSDYADKDLAFNLYEASFYNSYPFVNFSFVPNNHTYLGNYTDALISASTDITKYNWSLIRGNDGADGQDGKDGTNGKDGDPGKVVSDTEPTTKFKSLTWKYIGITAVDASDGTNIQPNTEYYWNGKNWVIYLINAQNIDVEKLTALTANLGDATAGSLTVEKGDTGGIAVKDGLVKSWDISKMTDPNYPDGYSYTSMGVALDSGGLTIYSAGYGITLDKGGVIDSQYKVASLQAIASNGRQNSGTGLILEANDSDFPFTVDGNIDVTGVVNQSYKQATVNFGYGRNVTLTRNGNYVTITSQNRYTIAPPNGTWLRNIATLPSGYRPVDDVLIYNHELSNSSKFSWSLLHPSGAIDLFSSGNILTTDYILSSSQCWITNDAMPS